MNYIIETNRFWLRELEEGDVHDLFELDSDPEVHRFLGNNPATHIDQSVEVIKSVHAQYQKFGVGRLAIISKQTNSFIGWTGLKYETKIRDLPYYDLGYRLKRKYWRQGIATETAQACLEYGFNVLSLSEINAAADIQNIASNKVLTNIGLKKTEEFYFEETLCAWYQIKPEDVID